MQQVPTGDLSLTKGRGREGGLGLPSVPSHPAAVSPCPHQGRLDQASPPDTSLASLGRKPVDRRKLSAK